ncbi:MAG: DUF3299 domain-containing protein [Desulfovibrio sp.]|jgi:hypothetical protein|nr:DUF3299 domain-containing protein [Desulfovibrio sp.]
MNGAICLALFCFFCQFSPVTAISSQTPYKDTQWEELVPKMWRPDLAFDGLDLENLPDNDPRVAKAYEAFMAEWEKAPVNEAMDGQQIKILGFIAPLDWENDAELKEFLLVPYFGACIHLPPPPANQIIYVKMEKALKGVQLMDAVWASGIIYVERNDSGSLGASGYRMKIEKVEPYTPDDT